MISMEKVYTRTSPPLPCSFAMEPQGPTSPMRECQDYLSGSSAKTHGMHDVEVIPTDKYIQ